MKTTITINLGSRVFHIDNDAYEMLQTYLLAVGKQFFDKEEQKEIMSDVELRLSELFTEILGEKRDVIMKEDISKVIDIMGEPEDFAEEDAKENTSSSNKQQKRKYTQQKTSRRLYRDPDNRILGGVCGGLGAYFNNDPLLFRVIFIILLFAGSVGFWIYLILWIAIPEASSTAQKLEMRGEAITIENIKKAVREEFENVRKNMKF